MKGPEEKGEWEFQCIEKESSQMPLPSTQLMQQYDFTFDHKLEYLHSLTQSDFVTIKD
jgi:hypothetical protein